jgi:hypothetical protein
MKNANLTLDEFAEKVLLGARLAYKKLVIETAAKNGSLVVRDKEGIIREVPAKELLKDLEQDR